MSKLSKEQIKKSKRIRQYSKYTGLPYQLLGFICVFGFIGYKLDQYFQNQNYYITAFLIIVGFGLFMYKLLVVLKNEK